MDFWDLDSDRDVQNKVLEAMAMAKPIVATLAAIQGIKAVNGKHVIVADISEDFIASVNRRIQGYLSYI
ncbi:MAG: glycosyltransferase [Desulfosarcina sp.]|nr:glycosyltransferase [Desulfosarcina sp.]MBC2741822.1 glycosyltransferase [Desulfosarcina sp.]